MNYIPSVTIPGKDENKIYDLYSMLLSERIIFITGEINDTLASTIVSEIIYLSAVSQKKKITIYILIKKIYHGYSAVKKPRNRSIYKALIII